MINYGGDGMSCCLFNLSDYEIGLLMIDGYIVRSCLVFNWSRSPARKWGTLCCVGSSLKYAFLLEGGKLVLPGRAKKRNDYYRMLLLEL